MPSSDSPLANRRKRVTDQLLAQLLTGVTVEHAASRVGCSESTAYRIIRTPAVQEQFRTLQKQVLTRATLKLTSSLDGAIDVLVEISKDAAQPGASRTSSALGIVKQAFANASLSDIEERIRQLEERHHNPTTHEEPAS
jgi:hypothetical protein